MTWLLAGAVTTVAALGPLHRPAEELFSAHMIQHLLLVTVAAPLLTAGLPGPAVFRFLPRVRRRAAARYVRGAQRLLHRTRAWPLTPAVAWVLHVAVLWAWHAPALYEAALRAPALHALEHVSLLVTAVLFWRPVLRRRGDRRLGAAAAGLYLFAAAGQSTALGALLTLSPRAAYAIHADTVSRWGLTALEDQHLAGLIMWVLGGLAYLVAALGVFARLLRDDPPARTATRAAAR